MTDDKRYMDSLKKKIRVAQYDKHQKQLLEEKNSLSKLQIIRRTLGLVVLSYLAYVLGNRVDISVVLILSMLAMSVTSYLDLRVNEMR